MFPTSMVWSLAAIDSPPTHDLAHDQKSWHLRSQYGTCKRSQEAAVNCKALVRWWKFAQETHLLSARKKQPRPSCHSIIAA